MSKAEWYTLVVQLMMSFFLYLARTRPFLSYADSQLFIKHSTKVKIKKNDEAVISLSVALLKSKSYHKYDDL